MIVEYHRPHTMEEALALLSRKTPRTVPLGGGTFLNRGRFTADESTFAVIDLQGLDLAWIEPVGNILAVGAMATLQDLWDRDNLPLAVRQALQHELNFNLRQVASLAGFLVAADGRSALATLLLAMDARLVWAPGEKEISLGDWLPLRGDPNTEKPGSLILSVKIPLQSKVAFAAVSRSPLDWPLVCSAVAQWPSGRTRLALGGFGRSPVLAMDGPGATGTEEAAKDASSQAGDEWASAEYRESMAGVLTRRCLNQIEGL
ncbi:MAG TPA: FAD binding domain-containing protein [Anaerolineaceae bacterium]|nr:FAD binding domain-containing protein [Anaerolineaceae bacterium]